MKIYTTYFAKVSKLPKNITPIAISLSVPKNMKITKCPSLAPTWNILSNYKEDGDEEKYIKRYKSDVLSKWTPKGLYKYFEDLVAGEDIAFVCYESPERFCHRHVIAEWLKEAGFEVEEWK